MKKIRPFNLYYLNLSKVYEISMMINNTVLTSIGQTQESGSKDGSINEITNNFDLGSKKFLFQATSGIRKQKFREKSQTYKIDRNFEVKTTKSNLLSIVLRKAIVVDNFNDILEGDLVKVDKIKLNLVDSEKSRTAHLLKRDLFKGVELEELRGFDLNNLINVFFQDQAFILESEVKGEKIAFKIPLSLENEFENQYRIDDILFSNTSIVGIYKGKLPIEAIKSNTFEYFSKGNGNSDDTIIGKEKTDSTNNKDEEIHFIDIIAITQDINFEKDALEILKWWQIRKHTIRLFSKFSKLLSKI